jgi:rhodanese-related sulfurtransferase
MGSVPARLAELDPNAVACLCHHGGRSMQVASFLHGNQGFTHVANIAGGIHAWADEVDPACRATDRPRSCTRQPQSFSKE